MARALLRNNNVRKRRETLRSVAPELDLSGGNNCPNPSIASGTGAVGFGRVWFACRVRVVIADDARPARPCGAMRGDKGCGVDFEMSMRCRMDVFGGKEALNPTFCAENKAATLFRRDALGFSD